MEEDQRKREKIMVDMTGETFIFVTPIYINREKCLYILIGKSTRMPLEVRLFTRMPLEVPNLPNYPYVQKNKLYKAIIHSNLQALFIKIPFKHKFL